MHSELVACDCIHWFHNECKELRHAHLSDYHNEISGNPNYSWGNSLSSCQYHALDFLTHLSSKVPLEAEGREESKQDMCRSSPGFPIPCLRVSFLTHIFPTVPFPCQGTNVWIWQLPAMSFKTRCLFLDICSGSLQSLQFFLPWLTDYMNFVCC